MALQATSFTQTQLIDRIKGDVGQRGQNLITDADVVAWSKEAMDEAAQQTGWYKVTDTVNCTSGTNTYDLPSSCIKLEYIAHNSLPLARITFDELNDTDPYWRQAGSSTPLAWYRRGVTSYVLFPTPGTTITNGIQRIYTAIPAMPATAGNVYDFPAANQQFLVEYCLFRAALKMTPGEGEGKVALYEKRHLMELERLKESVRELGGEKLVMGSRRTSWRRSPFDLSHRTIPAP